ncbi:hypothetical protein GCM10020229_60620 [Kitasatospora albolonga]
MEEVEVVVRHQSERWTGPTGPHGPVSGPAASAGVVTASEARAREVAAARRRAALSMVRAHQVINGGTGPFYSAG